MNIVKKLALSDRVVVLGLESMFDTQMQLNNKSYDTAWITKGTTYEFDYEIAAAQEIGEFLNSLPYSWWSKAEADRQNCVTELVDAWHFIMSQAIIDRGGDQQQAVLDAFEAYQQAEGSFIEQSVKRATKELVAALYMNEVNVGGHDSGVNVNYLRSFFRLCMSYDVSFDLLSARYLAKATLNKFRVAHGYKTGQYTKIWTVGDKKEEDNYFLSTYVDETIGNGAAPPSAGMVWEFLQ